MSLDTDDPYFEHQSNGGIKAEWSDDSSVAIITLDGKWGPRDVFLVEFHNGKVNRMTNILRKAHDLMLPNYRKSKAAHYKGSFDFILIEDAVFKLDGPHRVVIDADADSDPGYHPDLSDREWRGHIEAVWDIAQAKFTSKKVSGGPPAKED
jgi:hypothetical protein